MEKLPITPNVPVQIALKYPVGKVVEGRFGDQMYYTLAQPADTCMYLDMGPAQKIKSLDPQREPFWICKRWSGKKTDSPQWDVWPVGDGEQQPAPSPAAQATGIPDSEIELQLRASLAQIERNKQAASAPVAAHSHVTNGTNGAPKPYITAGIPAPPMKIPYDVAFRELLQIVIDGLKAAGEQWSDAAKQDALSTLLIQASRDGFLSCWTRGAK